MMRWGLGMILAMAVLAAGAAPPAPPAPRDRADKPDGWTPVVVETDDLGAGTKAKGLPASPAPAKPAAGIRVDEESKTVTVPVAFTRTKGVVERLLSAKKKNPGASVLVTEHSARDLAAALAKAGLVPGRRPEPVGEDRAKVPAGAALDITVVSKAADGKVTRTPAARFLSDKSSGEPLGQGAWVYVGPQMLREGDADVLVTEMTGAIVTTNLRDATAVVYWRPRLPDDAQPYVTAFYVSTAPLPVPGDTCELEIRPAAPPVSPRK
jgi:hypothetical protein